MEKKSNNKALIVLVLIFGGFAVCGCGGILAAIAVPAFQRYINRSKSVEAQGTVRRLASEAQMTFIETCKYPEPLAPTFEPRACCGGEKCRATAKLPAWAQDASLNDTFYSYSAQPGPGDTFVITAAKDFNCDGTPHTVSITVSGTRQGEVCNATSDSPVESAM